MMVKKNSEGQGKSTGSTELTFLERVAKSRSSEYRKIEQLIEDGPDHPSEDLLRDYVSCRLGEDATSEVMEHIGYCGICAKKALKIRWEENALESSWLQKIRELVSDISFPVYVQRPATEAVRGDLKQKKGGPYTIGEPVIFFFEAPSVGYMNILHYLRETDEAKWLFPKKSHEGKVSEGSEIPVPALIQGPSGRHEIIAVWTKEQLLSPEEVDWDDEDEHLLAVENFFAVIAGMAWENWSGSIFEYEVLSA